MIINHKKGGLKVKEIETERYEIRIPKIEDAEEIYEKWGTDKEKMAQYKEHKTYRNIIEAKRLINAVIEETEDGITFWIIEEKEKHEIVGYIKLQAMSLKNRKCEVAFYFLKKWRRDGTPEEVLSKVIEYIFTKTIYETVVMKYYATIQEDIEILHSILTKIGMIREGILRNRLINDKGKKIDRYIYSILKEEWEENKN
ncbi:N-acetyltransferase [bacterium]|nr:N-acetyltransferase [bacterium]